MSEQFMAYQNSHKDLKIRIKSEKKKNSNLMTQNSKLTSDIQSLNKQIEQLKEKNSQLTEVNQDQSKKIQQLESQIKNKLSNVNELNSSLEKKQKECSKVDKLVSQHQKTFEDISAALEKKLNRKVLKLEDFAQEILNYNPPIGTKLVTSHMLNGYDQQRSQIISTIEQFTQQMIGRTDLLVRHPEVKTILHAFPRDNKQFAFIVLYKTKQGTIFGSFSEGIRKPTFVFSFTPYEGNGQNNESSVNFFMPLNSSNKNNSIYLSDRYLQYGSEELKLNCLEPSKISASSVVGEENYYSFNWREVMNEDNEVQVLLSGVELHRVEFK